MISIYGRNAAFNRVDFMHMPFAGDFVEGDAVADVFANICIDLCVSPTMKVSTYVEPPIQSKPSVGPTIETDTSAGCC